MIEVEAPDGSIVEFPDGTPQEKIVEVMQASFGNADSSGDFTLAGNVPQGTDSKDILRAFFGQGVALGFGDEIEALVKSKFKGTEFEDEIKPIRQEIEEFAAKNPGSATGLELAGAFASMLVPGGAVAKGPAVAGAAKGAATGAAVGAVGGAGRGENAQERLAGATVGAGLGTVGGAVGGALARAPASVSKAVPAKTIEELKDTAQAAFTRAEQLGLSLSDKGAKRLNAKLQALKAAENIDKDLTTKSARVLKLLKKDLGGAVNFNGVLNLRRKAQIAAGAQDKADARAGAVIVDSIDEFMDGLLKSDVAGDVQKAGQAVNQLKVARDTWSRFRKGEIIDDVLKSAENSASLFKGSGVENAIRNKFRNLANNKKKLKPFSKEEVAAIEAVGNGNVTANVLQRIGGLAPTSTVPILSLLAGAGGGFAASGGIGAAAAPVIAGAGALGRLGATSLTRGRAKAASELVRGGSSINRGRPKLRRSISAGGLASGQPASDF